MWCPIQGAAPAELQGREAWPGPGRRGATHGASVCQCCFSQCCFSHLFLGHRGQVGHAADDGRLELWRRDHLQGIAYICFTHLFLSVRCRFFGFKDLLSVFGDVVVKLDLDFFPHQRPQAPTCTFIVVRCCCVFLAYVCMSCGWSWALQGLSPQCMFHDGAFVDASFRYGREVWARCCAQQASGGVVLDSANVFPPLSGHD